MAATKCTNLLLELGDSLIQDCMYRSCKLYSLEKITDWKNSYSLYFLLHGILIKIL